MRLKRLYLCAALAEGGNGPMTGMTMNRTAKTRTVWAALTVALLAGASAGSLDADRAIENGFASVIAGETGIARQAANIVAGSEDYWLRQPAGPNGQPATELERVVWHGPVAAGGKLEIGTGASRKQLDVISVEQVERPASTRIDMGTEQSVPLRVQARDGHDVSAPALWLELTAPAAINAKSDQPATAHTL
jgi:hypothetical protein